MKGTRLGVSRLRTRPEVAADHYLGRDGWEHSLNHLVWTLASGRGNPWPPRLSLRGRRAGGKVWVEGLARALSGLREVLSALGS